MNAGLMKVALVANLLWATFVGILCTDSGIGMLWFLLFFYGGAGLLALWALRALVHVAWGRKREPSAPWPSWVLEPVFVGLVATAVTTGLAFQVRFVMSKPFLDWYVRSVQSGDVVADRSLRLTLVGLFIVRETEALPNGVVRMITTTCGFDTCGLAYSPKGTPPVIGEDIYEPLGSGWWQWQASW